MVFRKKIDHSLKRIKEFYDAQKGQVYIANSGGKDSGVLEHLVHSLYPDVMSVFSNTTNEFIEIIQHIKTKKNIVIVHPSMSFNETVEKYGFPLISKKVALAITRLREKKPETASTRNLYLTGYNRKGQFSPRWKLAKKWYPLFEEAEFNITNKCCEILKHEPMARFQNETGLKPFVGTQIVEGGFRKDSWLKLGCNIVHGGKTDTSRPISIWTEDNIWEYTHKFNIPYSSIYDDVLDENGNTIIKGERRTGCAFCAFGADQEKSDLLTKNRFERLKLRKPAQYKKIMQLKNNGVTFDEALTFIKVKH
jgi:3'-phosphoadenosine 5'-phosphosulfate sulfotransferase (PAPS reductase)/FAD synthetase